MILELKDEIQKHLDDWMEVSDEKVLELIDQCILRKGKDTYIDVAKKRKLREEIYNSIRKLDVLQELIEDREITEIMINGPNEIFVERKGKIYPYEKKFSSREKLEDIIQQIVGKANRIINESNPIVDVRLEDGSRVNVVLRPVALDGPVVTIRKFPDEPITMETLVEIGSISKEAAQFLQMLVKARYNIFISGGTGSGKTTFLNALSNYIPEDERIITIEDSAELQIQNVSNLVRLETRNANIEGNNEIGIRSLIKSSLRMRPDRIIVGEIRDGAAVDLLAAMNTGHDGSLSTGHANSSQDMMRRLEGLVLQGMQIPIEVIQKQIVSALDIVVHLGRMRDKTRKVLEISEVIEVKNGQIILQPLFVFQETGEEGGMVKGHLVRKNQSLLNTWKLERAGIVYDGI